MRLLDLIQAALKAREPGEGPVYLRAYYELDLRLVCDGYPSCASGCAPAAEMSRSKT